MEASFLKDIENVQRRATKFITNDYSSDYKYRLICLQILPLMMQFELNHVMFFVSSIRNPTKSFNILQYVNFSGNFTRASVNYKLVHHMSRTNKVKHFYFHRLPRLWNSLPTINLDQSLSSIKFKLRQFFWSHFVNTLTQKIHVHSTLSAHVQSVLFFLLCITLIIPLCSVLVW